MTAFIITTSSSTSPLTIRSPFIKGAPRNATGRPVALGRPVRPLNPIIGMSDSHKSESLGDKLRQGVGYVSEKVEEAAKYNKEEAAKGEKGPGEVIDDGARKAGVIIDEVGKAAMDAGEELADKVQKKEMEKECE
eukprot:CAMPEP_0184721282 /NCGR_PEP_ID=MMETSP0314-20130426/17736_1 /TAXON_ID=38298 /ORGANISM="Rhodella maculata, Strain CCMP 736" /LENGTH=134 /DNA_ID=CAMNT_0027185605 /DNA_START=89 /DNA_END=493 /DNA_ORIENTATION=-